MSITFHNVHKTLRQKNKKTKVFESVDVAFAADRITGILAPPGSGKTTATNLTTGRLRPDIGRVKRDALVSFPVAGGGVFNGLLTGRENLAFLCRVFGFDPRPIIKFVVDYADLGKVIDKPFRLYTRDERTRMIFTSGYAIPFETFVIDETIIGGRGPFRDKCEDLVRQRMETSGFIIYSSSPRLLKKYCSDFFALDGLAIYPVDNLDEAVARIGENRLKDGEGYSEDAVEGGESLVLKA